VLVLSSVASTSGCTDAKSGPAAGGELPQSGRGSIDLDGGRQDARTAQPPGDIDGGKDATASARTDSGNPNPSADAGACMPAACPAAPAEALRLAWIEEPYVSRGPCCTGEFGAGPDRCGVWAPAEYGGNAGETVCVELVDGVADDRCLDALVGGERIEGCLRPDGRCGHLTEGWGCHTLHRAFWSGATTRPETAAASGLPNPFTCTQRYQPCTRVEECCHHPNYGAVCEEFVDQEEDGGGSSRHECTFGDYE
jgi:hypothetical protein